MSFLHLLAQTKINPNDIGLDQVTDPNSVLAGVLTAVYTWAGIICVLIIVVAGYLYTTSGGNASETKRAREAILGAVIGLVVILMAFTITQFVLGRF